MIDTRGMTYCMLMKYMGTLFGVAKSKSMSEKYELAVVLFG